MTGAAQGQSLLRAAAPPKDPQDAASADNWTFVGSVPAVSEGWKLYISASNANFSDTLKAAAPVLALHSASYKHVASERVLRKINSGLYGYSQIGKTIVVYIDDPAKGRSLVQALKPAVRMFAHSTMLPPFADLIGGGLPLSYRYGAFAGEEITIGGMRQADRRTRRPSTMAGLPENPFTSCLEPAAETTSLDGFLTSYPVFEVISQSAKGGIYAAMDLSSPVFREVIIKLGRRRGHVLPDGRDGSDLIRRESWFYDRAKEHGLARVIPVLDGLFEFGDGALIVLERVEGKSLEELNRSGELEPRTLDDAMAILAEFHRKGLLVGDAKLSNFILGVDGTLRIIDFEAGSLLSETSLPDQHTTFVFTDDRLSSRPCERELLHFLYSALHEEQASSFDETTRIIDLASVIATDRTASPVQASARRTMRLLLDNVRMAPEIADQRPPSNRMSSPAS